MLSADDLPDEFTPPVAHSSTWLLLALLALAAVAVYYVVVTLWARPRRQPPPPAPPSMPPPRRDPREKYLERLEAVERDVADGTVSARDGHQRLSATVRSYVAEVTHLPADTMTLSDLREAGAGELTDVVALMYPPSFAPNEEGHAADRFPEALDRARGVVTSWI